MTGEATMSRTALRNLQSLTLLAARAGGRAITEAGDAAGSAVDFKHGNPQDPVTDADRASEAAIRAVVALHRREDAVLGEEAGTTPGTSGLRWVVDPLDGTVNYSHGLSRYAVSVAVEREETGPVIAASIFQPATGAWLGLEPGGVCGSPAPAGVDPGVPAARSLVAFAVPNEPEHRRRAYRLLTDLAPRVQDLRNFGSTVCDLAQVAAGGLNGFVSFDPAPWDIAAGVAIVRAAGGTSRRWRRDDGMEVVVAGCPAVVDTVTASMSD